MCIRDRVKTINGEDHSEFRDDLKSLRNRLPPWVLAVGSAAGVLIGVLATLIAKGV